MPRFSLFCCAVLALFLSCSSSNDPLDIDRWELSSTFSYMTNTEVPASELDFSETVEFVSDGLFLKSRTRDGETLIFEGSWEATDLNEMSVLLVRYTENNILIANCTAQPEESYFISEGRLIQNNMTPCDGPEYRYERGNN